MAYLKVIYEVNSLEWNNDVARLKGCAFHSYEWSTYSGTINNAEAVYFRWHDDSGAVRGLAIGLLRAKQITGIHFFKNLSFGSFPATDGDNVLREMLQKIVEFCCKNRMTSLEMHSFGTPFGTEILNDMGFSTRRRWEFLLNIDLSTEDLWARISQKKRNKIRKAEKEGLRIERDSKGDRILMLRQFGLDTKKRKAQEGIDFPVAEKSYYQSIKSKLIDSGLAKLYLAYDGDQPLAGGLFLGFNHSVYYMLSSASDEGLKKAAPDLILWSCIKDYQHEGYEIFNFGGVSEGELHGEPLEKSGLYYFKKKFSSNEHLCFKGNLVLRPASYRIYNLLKKIRSITGN